jgi:hypothetical protein
MSFFLEAQGRLCGLWHAGQEISEVSKDRYVEKKGNIDVRDALLAGG